MPKYGILQDKFIRPRILRFRKAESWEQDMKYTEIVSAEFIERPNRFIAYVDLMGARTKVHVKIRADAGSF